MKIEVLGMGCATCNKVYQNALEAVKLCGKKVGGHQGRGHSKNHELRGLIYPGPGRRRRREVNRQGPEDRTDQGMDYVKKNLRLFLKALTLFHVVVDKKTFVMSLSSND